MKRNGPRRRRTLAGAVLGLCGWLAVAPAGAGPATEATAAALQRIEAWNGQLLAVIATDPTATVR